MGGKMDVQALIIWLGDIRRDPSRLIFGEQLGR